MTLDELREIEARHAGKPDDTLAFVGIAKSMTGLPVRPKILEVRADGAKMYGFTLKQVRKLIVWHTTGPM